MKSAVITEWLTENSINRTRIFSYFSTIFLDRLYKRFYKYDADYLVNVSLPRGVDATVDSVDLSDVSEEISHTVFNGQLIVRGDIFVEMGVSVGIDNESGQSISFGSGTAEVVVTFTFTMDQNEVNVDTLEFSNIEVIEKADFRFLYEDYEE